MGRARSWGTYRGWTGAAVTGTRGRSDYRCPVLTSAFSMTTTATWREGRWASSVSGRWSPMSSSTATSATPRRPWRPCGTSGITPGIWDGWTTTPSSTSSIASETSSGTRVEASPPWPSSRPSGPTRTSPKWRRSGSARPNWPRKRRSWWSSWSKPAWRSIRPSWLDSSTTTRPTIWCPGTSTSSVNCPIPLPARSRNSTCAIVASPPRHGIASAAPSWWSADALAEVRLGERQVTLLDGVGPGSEGRRRLVQAQHHDEALFLDARDHEVGQLVEGLELQLPPRLLRHRLETFNRHRRCLSGALPGQLGRSGALRRPEAGAHQTPGGIEHGRSQAGVVGFELSGQAFGDGRDGRLAGGIDRRRGQRRDGTVR